MRHRRRADLAGLETLGGQLDAGHQPDRGGQRRRRGGQLDERGEHVVVQRARVDLADAGQLGGEPQVRRDPALQLGQLVRVAAEQVEHVLRGAHRTLDAAQRVAGAQLLQPGERDQHLVGRRGEPLAQRRRLRGDVVAAPGHHQLGVLGGAPGQPGEHRHRPVPDVLTRQPDLQLLDVLGEVAAGQALVHVLVPGEGVELLDARLDVVPGDPLAGGDGVEVDLLDDPLVVGHDVVGDVDAEVALGFEDCQPEVALEDDLVLGRPQADELRARVAGGQDIGDHG